MKNRIKSIGKVSKNILYITVIICSLSLVGTKLFTAGKLISRYCELSETSKYGKAGTA